MESKLREGLRSCKTDKQVIALLKKLKLTILDDKTLECGYLNLWLDDQTRVYGSKKRGYKLQLWHKVEEKIIGKKIVPMCYGRNVSIDDIEIISHEYNGIFSQNREMI